MLNSIHVRWAIRRDFPEILPIERACFEFPWSEDDFVRCLRQRNCIGMVAEIAERVAGFMVYELERDLLRVLNFAVNPSDQRQGVGRAMLDKLKTKLSSQRRSRLRLNIRERNFAAQSYFRHMGFTCVGIERDLYEDCDDDAYVFEYCVDGNSEFVCKSVNCVFGRGANA